MARYDYKCTSCGTVFEVQHGMTERPEVHCPSCGADAEKVFTQQLRRRLRQLPAQGQLVRASPFAR